MGSKKASVVGTAPTMSPQQTGLVNQTIDMAGKALGNFNLDLTQNPAYQSALSSVGTFTQPFERDRFASEFDETVGAPAIEQFIQRTRPDAVAQGLYGTGSRNSSALDLALSEAQRSLTTDLSRLKTQSMSQAYENYMGRQLQGTALQAELSAMPLNTLLPFIQTALAKPTEQPIIQPGRAGFGEQILSGIAGSIPIAVGGLVGGPAGAGLAMAGKAGAK